MEIEEIVQNCYEEWSKNYLMIGPKFRLMRLTATWREYRCLAAWSRGGGNKAEGEKIFLQTVYRST